MRKHTLLLLSAILLAGGMTAAEAGRQVPGSTLRKLHGVYTAYWKGKKAKVQIFRNGTLRAQYTNKVDVGRWKVKGDVLCVSFRVWTHGKPKCGTVEREGGWLVGLRNSKGVPRLKLRR